MSEILASQVAAGEVVERPASVIKELVENSLDAGAKTISVEIRRGGSSFLKVTDDGCGMAKEDLDSCILRHATSKLFDQSDLFRITQLGFRGEAIPSIASVSRLRIGSRERDAIEGWEILVDGGVHRETRACGLPPGTSIEVSELFYNTPARREFLKSRETETAHIEHQLRLHALAFPEVRFIFKKDDQTGFDLPSTNDLRSRIALLTDNRTAGLLIPIEPTYGAGVTVSGYLLPFSEARRNKKGQFAFLNKRPIEDQLVSRAIRDGYGGFPSGFHPSVYLYLEVTPELVDVNVHPAKREVRFRRPSDVISTIIQAISDTLSLQARSETRDDHTIATPPTDHNKESSADQQPSGKTPQPIAHSPSPGVAFPAPRPQVSIRPLPASQPELRPILQNSQANQALPSNPPQRDLMQGFTPLGILHRNCALFETAEGLSLLHSKNARERIFFERFMASEQSRIPSQMLLDPIILELDPRDFVLVQSMIPQFDQAGISIAPFGQQTMRVESLPDMVPQSRAKPFILDIIDRMSAPEQSKKAGKIAFETFAAEIAKKAAFEGFSSQMDATETLRQLLKCEVPYCTPSGKPTLVMISNFEIARKFGITP